MNVFSLCTRIREERGRERGREKGREGERKKERKRERERERERRSIDSIIYYIYRITYIFMLNK